jgi:DNA-binding CsgD family transcriptional regulator
MQTVRPATLATARPVNITDGERAREHRANFAAPDLHQILCSSGLAVMMFDTGLILRYLTPAASALFARSPPCIGRGLAALQPLSPDASLLSDATRVLAGKGGLLPVKLPVKDGLLCRQIHPYGSRSGVVISYSLALPPSPPAPQGPCPRGKSLTPRQQAVLQGVLAGRASKTIAYDLGISPRTVESHRSAIMQKLGAKSLPELVRMVLFAA